MFSLAAIFSLHHFKLCLLIRIIPNCWCRAHRFIALFDFTESIITIILYYDIECMSVCVYFSYKLYNNMGLSEGMNYFNNMGLSHLKNHLSSIPTKQKTQSKITTVKSTIFPYSKLPILILKATILNSELPKSATAAH